MYHFFWCTLYDKDDDLPACERLELNRDYQNDRVSKAEIKVHGIYLHNYNYNYNPQRTLPISTNLFTERSSKWIFSSPERHNERFLQGSESRLHYSMFCAFRCDPPSRDQPDHHQDDHNLNHSDHDLVLKWWSWWRFQEDNLWSVSVGNDSPRSKVINLVLVKYIIVIIMMMVVMWW